MPRFSPSRGAMMNPCHHPAGARGHAPLADNAEGYVIAEAIVPAVRVKTYAVERGFRAKSRLIHAQVLRVSIERQGGQSRAASKWRSTCAQATRHGWRCTAEGTGCGRAMHIPRPVVPPFLAAVRDAGQHNQPGHMGERCAARAAHGASPQRPRKNCGGGIAAPGPREYVPIPSDGTPPVPEIHPHRMRDDRRRMTIADRGRARDVIAHPDVDSVL